MEKRRFKCLTNDYVHFQLNEVCEGGAQSKTLKTVKEFAEIFPDDWEEVKGETPAETPPWTEGEVRFLHIRESIKEITKLREKEGSISALDAFKHDTYSTILNIIEGKADLPEKGAALRILHTEALSIDAGVAETVLSFAQDYPKPEPKQEAKKPALATQEGGDHYKNAKIQPLEYIYANGLNFAEGSVIKYVTRHRRKNGKEDIKKAIHLLELILDFEYDTEEG